MLDGLAGIAVLRGLKLELGRAERAAADPSLDSMQERKSPKGQILPKLVESTTADAQDITVTVGGEGAQTPAGPVGVD